MRAHTDRAGLLDGREGEPDGLALDSLYWHAEAERRAAGASESLTGRLLRAIAARIRRAEAPVSGRWALETLQRTLHNHLLRTGREFGLDLDTEALARIANDLADWYEPERHTVLVPDRAAACVAACEGIPTGSLQSGIVALLYEAMVDAEREVDEPLQAPAPPPR